MKQNAGEKLKEKAESDTRSEPIAQHVESKNDKEASRLWSRPREHFIPVAKSDLEEMLPDIGDLTDQDRGAFHRVCQMMDALIHYQYHRDLLRVMKVYAPLDPDSAVVQTSTISEKLRRSLTDQLFEELTGALKRANYKRLNRQEIETAIASASQLGIQLLVNFDIFHRLEVYVRGDAKEIWTKKSWATFFKKREIEVSVYRRLIVAFRVREHKGMKESESTDSVYIKTFKNIPHSDLDVLLPGTRVKMTLLDRGKILVPTVSGMVLNVWKATRALMLLTVFASILTIFKWIGLLIAVVGYSIRMVFGHMRTKDKYLLNLTQHLYFQNLDNNRGGLYRILNEAEDQEFREAIIAYFQLWQSDQPLSESELDVRCEKLIKDSLGVEVDFEICDALRKLEEYEVAFQDEQGNWSAHPPVEALKRMDYKWDTEFNYNDSRD